MKKNYEKPAIETVELEAEDIIQTSGFFSVDDNGYIDNVGGGTDNGVGVGTGGVQSWL